MEGDDNTSIANVAMGTNSQEERTRKLKLAHPRVILLNKETPKTTIHKFPQTRSITSGYILFGTVNVTNHPPLENSCDNNGPTPKARSSCLNLFIRVIDKANDEHILLDPKECKSTK